FPSWTSTVRIRSPALDTSHLLNVSYTYLPAVGSAAWKDGKNGSLPFLTPEVAHAENKSRLRPRLLQAQADWPSQGDPERQGPLSRSVRQQGIQGPVR